jgi:ribosomal-protein-alanine N-acetyltransferase
MVHLGTKELISERLILRRFKESDAKELYEGFINQEGFLYYAHKEKRTLEDEIASLKDIDEKYENLEYYNWLIALKDDGIIIGAINLNVDNFNESVEFNYAIDERFKGNGYMTEALNLVKDFCLDEIKVNRFYGGCEINNIGSKRVMEKCGLTYEGTLKSHIKLRDGYHDMLLYAIVQNEI